MPIWFDKNLSLQHIQSVSQNTMGGHLALEWVDVGEDYLKMRMPVNDRNRQPYGLLHGGASCVLAETIGSMASFYVIDNEKFNCVGLEINANHIRSVKDGFVTATCKPLHLGKTTHVWDIRLYNDKEQLTCVSRLTVAIIEKKY